MDNSKRQRCEVYSRVVGYLRPVAQWNDGKRAEFFDRKVFTIQTAEDGGPLNKTTAQTSWRFWRRA